MRRSMKLFYCAFSLALSLPLGCDGGDDEDTGGDTGAVGDDGDDGGSGAAEDSTGGGEQVDEGAVVAAAADYASLQRVTDQPYASQHGLAASVHVWVPADLVPAYLAIGGGTAPGYAPGALLVKEHLDAEGAHAGLTVMFKGPEGYAPESGDWWWGLVNGDGTLAQGGQVGACVSCHTGASATDFVFGLPQ